MKKLASLFLAVLILTLSVGFVSAQVGNLDSIALTAIPPRLGDEGEIKVKPGEKFQTTVRVTNNSDHPLDIETFVQDFIIGEDGMTPVLVNDDTVNRWSLAKWVTLTPNNQSLGAKKTGVVNVLIEVPVDAAPGGHFAIIAHQPSTGKVAGDGNSISGVTQRVGTILYVNVEGDVKESAFIHDFEFNPKIAEFGPMNFSFNLENQSDIHLRPKASVEVFNMFGKKVTTIPVEPNNVFPGSTRKFTGTWSVSWGFGPYKAVLTVPYGTQGGVTTAITTVWLLPLSIIIAGIILLLAIVTSIIVIKRHLAYRVELAKKEMALRDATDQSHDQKDNPEETA